MKVLRRIKNTIVIFSLCLVFLSITVQAYDVAVQPVRIHFSGTKGDIVTKTATVINGGTTPVLMRARGNASGLLVAPETFVLNASSSLNIVIFYTLPKNISSGNFTLTLTDLNITVTVNYTIAPAAPEPQAPVEVFPNPPKSGSNIAIFFTGTNRGLSAQGFLSVNGYIYPVEIEGYGIVSLDKNAYGTATLYLFGSSIEQEDSRKTFDIVKGIELLVTVDMPRESSIDSDVPVIVKYGPDTVGNVEVRIIDPDENEQTFTTNNQGKVEFTANEIGKWKATVTAEGQTATATIQIKYGYLPLGLVEETQQIGDTVTIVTDENAEIDVYIDGNFEFSHTAPTNGLMPLSLTKGGTYVLKGELGNKRGEYTFSVPGEAQISIIDPLTFGQVDRIEKNKRYTIKVTDSSGNSLYDAETLWIQNPTGTKELLSLTEGMGTWYPLMDGPYTLMVDDTTTVTGASKYIIIKPVPAEYGWLTAVLTVCILMAAIMVILYVVARKRGIPMRYVIPRFFKKKRKIELPIG